MNVVTAHDRSGFTAIFEVARSGGSELRLLRQIREQLEGFNIYERPVEFDHDPLKVEMGLTLQQIIDVVRAQILRYVHFF